MHFKVKNRITKYKTIERGKKKKNQKRKEKQHRRERNLKNKK